MKTTFELPDDLYRQAKAMAVLKGLTMKEWMTQLLRREVSTTQPGKAAISGSARQGDDFVKELDRLTALVSERWQGPQDAVAAVREQRRDSGA